MHENISNHLSQGWYTRFKILYLRVLSPDFKPIGPGDSEVFTVDTLKATVAAVSFFFNFQRRS